MRLRVFQALRAALLRVLVAVLRPIEVRLFKKQLEADCLEQVNVVIERTQRERETTREESIATPLDSEGIRFDPA